MGSTFTLTAGRAYVGRFVPSRSMRLTQIALGIIAAASVNDPVEVAIYNAALTQQLATTGQVAGILNAAVNSAPTAPLGVPVPIVVGKPYYFALCCPTVGGTAANLYGTNLNGIAGAIMFGSAIGTWEMAHYTNGTGLLAADIHLAAFLFDNSQPCVALREV